MLALPGRVVAEQIGAVVVVRDDDVEVTVPVDIRHGEPPADLLDAQPWAGGALEALEGAVAAVEEEQVRLCVAGDRLPEQRDVVDEMAVDDHPVEVPIQIGVEHLGPPAHEKE